MAKYERNLTQETIVDLIGMNPATLSNKSSNRKLTERNWSLLMRSNSNIDWADVQRLKESGVPMTELAEMYGVHKDTIRYNTTAIDIQESDWGKAQALRDAGWSVGAIAKELRTTKDAVHRNTHQPVPKKRYENEWNQDEPPIMKSADLI